MCLCVYEWSYRRVWLMEVNAINYYIFVIYDYFKQTTQILNKSQFFCSQFYKWYSFILHGLHISEHIFPNELIWSFNMSSTYEYKSIKVLLIVRYIHCNCVLLQSGTCSRVTFLVVFFCVFWNWSGLLFYFYFCYIFFWIEYFGVLQIALHKTKKSREKK